VSRYKGKKFRFDGYCSNAECGNREIFSAGGQTLDVKLVRTAGEAYASNLKL
jgi:hypothetical protein